MLSELPVILIVEQKAGDLGGPSRELESRFRVVTCPVEVIALEYVLETRPAAVLLDANAFYLDGAGVTERWRSVVDRTRVFFVDSEGPWVLLVELGQAAPEQVEITPCTLAGLGPAMDEVLGRRSSGNQEPKDDRLAVVAE